MNMISCFSARLVAGLILSGGLLLAPAGRADDAVARFAKAELGLDLARYKLGTALADFPELLRQNATATGTSVWHKVSVQRPTPAGTNAAIEVELRFDANRLAALRTSVVDFSKSMPENHRLWAAFQKMVAQPHASNLHRYVVETAQWRMSCEGFCTPEYPVILQFNLAVPKSQDTP